jgi:hypothetical protein
MEIPAYYPFGEPETVPDLCYNCDRPMDDHHPDCPDA